MFIIAKVIELHDEVLRIYGGASGIRDAGLLDAALNRCFQTFGGEELYPSPFEKSAAVLESILLNHPFIDGNKRTGFLLCATLLLEHNIQLTSSEDERYDFIVSLASSKIPFGEIVTWLQQNSILHLP